VPIRVRARVAVDLHGVEGGRVLGDPNSLRRLVVNLLDNAERHAGSRIEVTLHQLDHHVELTVADDGPGIPSADRERIFERFARIDEARSRDRGGTGLGLAIARDIAVSHGGSIDVTNRTGGGARFVARLPAAG
jgi:signal transduction histidine kinase